MATRQGRKSLNCKVCDTKVDNVGEEAVAVTCSKCVQASLCVPIASSTLSEESDPEVEPED